MTDLDVVLSELKGIKDTQKAQGNDIRELSKGFAVLAVQSEQIANLQNQTSILWKEMNEVQKFQASCPRDSLGVFKQDVKDIASRQWIAIGVLFAALVGIAGWIKFGG